MKRIIIATALAVVLIAQTACGENFSTSLRLVVAAGAPVLSLLVQQGKLSQATKEGLVADLTNEGFKVGDMTTCFSGIAANDPQSKLKHLQCVQTLEQSAATKKLLKDFSAVPAVQNIADDFDAILQAALIFYGGSPKPGARRGITPPTVTKEEISRRINRLKADLGQ